MPAMVMSQSPRGLTDQGDVTTSCPRKSQVGEEGLWPIELIKGLGTFLPFSLGRSSRNMLPFCYIKIFPVGGQSTSWVGSPLQSSPPRVL